jgi:hypothetical protein
MTAAVNPVPPAGPSSLPAVGAMVRVRGKRGTWTVRGMGRDGSVTLTGGPSHQWRSVMPDRIVVVTPRKPRAAPIQTTSQS